MKLIPFSPDLCQQLLDEGYCNFVKRYQDDIAASKVTTFEAVRDREQPSIPIQQIMHLPPDTLSQYYVMVRE